MRGETPLVERGCYLRWTPPPEEPREPEDEPVDGEPEPREEEPPLRETPEFDLPDDVEPTRAPLDLPVPPLDRPDEGLAIEPRDDVWEDGPENVRDLPLPRSP